MTSIKKILILITILLFINYLTNGKIINTFKRLFSSFSCEYNKTIAIKETPKSEKHVNFSHTEEEKAYKDNKILKNTMTESFDNMFVNREPFDDLFIKSNNCTKKQLEEKQDSDYDLIPSISEFV